MATLNCKEAIIIKRAPALVRAFVPGASNEAIISYIQGVLQKIPAARKAKRTSNDMIVILAAFVIHHLGVTASTKQIMDKYLEIHNLKHLSKATRYRESANHPDLIRIQKTIDATSNTLGRGPGLKACHPDRLPDLVDSLCDLLHFGDSVKKLSKEYLAFREDPTLASRCQGTIVAAAVFTAAKISRLEITLEDMSAAAGVSSCTIRKASNAILQQLAPKSCSIARELS